MRRIASTLAIAATIGLGLAGCGSSDGVDTDGLKTQLVDELELTDEQAGCVIDELGDDANVLVEAMEPDFAPSEDDITALDRAGDECGLE